MITPELPELPEPAPSAAPRRPCVIDVEASGFGRSSYPIEVGYVLPDGRSCCTLIRPAVHWTHWDPQAERVHGISRQTLITHGRSPADVVRVLNADLTGCTVYCDGWAHDYAWLAVLYEEAGVSPGFRLESVNSLLDETAMTRLSGLQASARVELGLSRHRASNDARALQHALLRLGTRA